MAVIATWKATGLADGTLLANGSAGTGDTPWTTVTSNGSPFHVSASGLHTPRIRVNQAGGEAAQLVWSTAVIGSLTAHAVSFYFETSGYPSSPGRLAAAHDDINGIKWFLDVSAAGIMRLRNTAGTVIDQSAAAIPLNTEIRVEVIADGLGAIDVYLFSGDSAVEYDYFNGATGFGTDFEQMRFGTPNASPTWPQYYLDDIVVTNTALPIGPTPSLGGSVGFRGQGITLLDTPGDAVVLGRPTESSTGDLLLAAVVSPATVTPPSGWTAVTVAGTPDYEGLSAGLWSRTVASGERTSYSFGLATADEAVGAIAAFSGWDAITEATVVTSTLTEDEITSGAVTVVGGGRIVLFAVDRREDTAIAQTWTDSDSSDKIRQQASGSDGSGDVFSAAIIDSDRALAAADYPRTLTAGQNWIQAMVWAVGLDPSSSTTDDSARMGALGDAVFLGSTVLAESEVTMGGTGALDVDDSLVSVVAGPVDLAGTGALVLDDSQVTVPAGPVDLEGAGALDIDDATVLLITSVTMGGVGGLSATVRYPETLLVNGIDIYECIQFMTPDMDGLISPPSKKTPNVDVPGRHGAVFTPHKRYGVAQMPLTVWVKGTNPDGTIPSNRREAFYENLNTILRAFTGQVTLEHVMPDGTSRVIEAEVLDKIDFTRYVWGAVGKVGVVLTAVYPFWSDTETSTATLFAEGTDTLEEFAPATAPIENMVITFTGPATNPRLTSGDFYVQYNRDLIIGERIIIDVGNWTLTSPDFTPDYAALEHAGIGHWFTLEPDEGGPVVTYSQTGSGPGTVEIVAKNVYLGG